MSVELIARRYAGALADVVLSQNTFTVVKYELGEWSNVISDNADLAAVFANPTIGHIEKSNVLDALLAKTKPSKTTENFLRVLLKNNRLSDIAFINKAFEAELEERSGDVTGFVESARDLNEKERAELKAGLEKMTGRNVNLKYKTDKELIGGVVARIGSTVYDNSVRTQLNKLREQLMER